MVFLAGESCDLSLDRIDSEVAGAALRDRLERLPGSGETGLLACDFLEARQNLIAIGRIILDHARPAACPVRGDQRAARSGERVEHQFVTTGAIHDGVGDQRDRGLFRRTAPHF
jgi:hypothetical protein